MDKKSLSIDISIDISSSEYERLKPAIAYKNQVKKALAFTRKQTSDKLIDTLLEMAPIILNDVPVEGMGKDHVLISSVNLKRFATVLSCVLTADDYDTLKREHQFELHNLVPTP